MAVSMIVEALRPLAVPIEDLELDPTPRSASRTKAGPLRHRNTQCHDSLLLAPSRP